VAAHRTFIDEAGESVGQHVGRDGERALQFAESIGPEDDLAKDQDIPTITHEPEHILPLGEVNRQLTRQQ
jgi:hypothetical protein